MSAQSRRFTRKRVFVVYDMDNTLLDSSGIHIAAWKFACRAIGVEATSKFLAEQVGKTNREAAQRFLGERFDELGEKLITAKVAYVTEHADEAVFFHDWQAALPEVQKRASAVWIATSSNWGFVDKVGQADPAFQSLPKKTADDHSSKSEMLKRIIAEVACEASDLVYVGDSVKADGNAAIEAGCRFVLYDPNSEHPDVRDRITSHKNLLNLIP